MDTILLKKEGSIMSARDYIDAFYKMQRRGFKVLKLEDNLYRLVNIPKCRFRILTLLCLFAKQKGIRVDAFGIHPGREKIIT